MEKTRKKITDLAKHIGKTQATLFHKRKVSPKEFNLLWKGWCAYCDEQNKDKTD